MNITIKERAAEMLKNKLLTGEFLRVAVTAGGCAGLTYSAEVARDMQDGEGVVYSIGPVRVVADLDSTSYLEGLVIDYSDDLLHGGLQFTNNNTESTCGCGQSFNLKGFPAFEGGQCHH